MTTQQKFTAAVNVIRNLPKNGAFQPSTDLQLKFYSYYKQATEGPNAKPKPSIWDIPGRKKWGAWTELGNMSQNDAMYNYIEELKSIVETMSYNANVESFLSSLGPFYDCVPAEDVDLVLGPVIEKVKSRGHSPTASKDALPRQAVADEKKIEETSKTKNSDIPRISPSESDDEEFSDVVESVENTVEPMHMTPTPESSSGQSYTLDSPNSDSPCTITQAIARLQDELNQVTNRVHALENAFVANSIIQMKEREKKEAEKNRRIFDLPLAVWGFIVFWPLAAHIMTCYVRGTKRN